MLFASYSKWDGEDGTRKTAVGLLGIGLLSKPHVGLPRESGESPGTHQRLLKSVPHTEVNLGVTRVNPEAGFAVVV